MGSVKFREVPLPAPMFHVEGGATEPIFPAHLLTGVSLAPVGRLAGQDLTVGALLNLNTIEMSGKWSKHHNIYNITII